MRLPQLTYLIITQVPFHSTVYSLQILYIYSRSKIFTSILSHFLSLPHQVAKLQVHIAIKWPNTSASWALSTPHSWPQHCPLTTPALVTSTNDVTGVPGSPTRVAASLILLHYLGCIHLATTFKYWRRRYFYFHGVGNLDMKIILQHLVKFRKRITLYLTQLHTLGLQHHVVSHQSWS